MQLVFTPIGQNDSSRNVSFVVIVLVIVYLGGSRMLIVVVKVPSSRADTSLTIELLSLPLLKITRQIKPEESGAMCWNENCMVVENRLNHSVAVWEDGEGTYILVTAGHVENTVTEHGYHQEVLLGALLWTGHQSRIMREDSQVTHTT